MFVNDVLMFLNHVMHNEFFSMLNFSRKLKTSLSSQCYLLLSLNSFLVGKLCHDSLNH